MSTCLFTGLETNTPSTHEEHTILRQLGGRFRSRTSSSTSFNNACSQRLDVPLGDFYSLITNMLDPLFTAEHRQASMPTLDGNVELAPGHVVQLRRTRIEERDPVSGRPVAASSDDETSLARIARQAGWIEGRIQKSTAPVVTASYVRRRQPVLSPLVEVALLKCGLLTFDHLLNEDDAFTRNEVLAPLRAGILGVVQGDESAPLLARHCLGINYSLRPVLIDLARSYPHASSRFEHVMLVSGRHQDPLDLLFLVAGVDAYQFRLCERWPGADLSAICGCGMLAGDRPFGLEFPEAYIPAAPTNLRWSPSAPPGGLLRDVLDEHLNAYRDAVVLVESRADDFVVEFLLELGPLGFAGTLREAVRHRLRRLHESVLTPQDERRRDALLDTRVPEVVPVDRPLDSLDDRSWLPAYRRLLQDLITEFGRPGLIFPS